jgi:hypothetical protein
MSVGLSTQEHKKEVPTVEHFTIDVAAVRLGAVCLAARSPWANVAAARVDHALGQSHVPAVGGSGAHHAALLPVPAARATAQLPQRAQSALPMAAELFPMTTNTVTFTRKPKNVHKTRINAGGYGAMGPHPEREPLA